MEQVVVKKASLRAWLLMLLARLETDDIVEAEKTDSGTVTDIQIKWR